MAGTDSIWYVLTELKSQKKKWHCFECSRKSIFLKVVITEKLLILREQKKICPIKKDGNCLFSSLSSSLYEYPGLHDDVQKYISSHMRNIIEEKIMKTNGTIITVPMKTNGITPQYNFCKK